MVKNFLTSGLVMLAAFSLHAFDNDYKCYSLDANGNKTYWSLNGQKTGFIKNAVKTPYKQPSKQINIGDPKPLDIEIRYDENEYYLECIQGGQYDNGFYISEPIKKLGIQNIPFGVSGLLCVFQKHNPLSGETDMFFVAKDISDLNANSKVIFDINECIHKINYEPLGEDGQPLSISKIKGDQLIEAGKYAYGFSFITIAHIADATMYCADAPYQRYISSDNSDKYARPGNIWFNNCGPNFIMGHHIIAAPQEGRDFTIIEMPVYQGQFSSYPKNIVLSNDPSQFKTYTQKWTRSPWSVATYNELPFGAQIFIEAANTAITGFGSEILYHCDETGVETHTIVCGNPYDNTQEQLMSMILIDQMPDNDFAAYLGKVSMWWKEGSNGRSYLPNNFTGNQGTNAPYNTYYNYVEGNYSPWNQILDAHNPYLSFQDSYIDGRLGNNTPIISLMPELSSATPDFLGYYYGIVGRYGEGYAGCGDFMEITLSDDYNSDNFRKDEFLYENILIDGEIYGSVKAVQATKKGGVDDDYIPPVLTFLLTRNNDNIFTDRFNTASDGIVEFYAGDFYKNIDWSMGIYGHIEYQCKPVADVKVEYAPYQTDNFTELTVTEVPEKYFYPGWGNYYTVPLKDVSAKSANAWFDLRISLEDEAGNTHVQTISPAFRINDASGVETVCSDTDSREPVYYDMMGRRIVNPADGIFIERRGNVSRKVMK